MKEQSVEVVHTKTYKTLRTTPISNGKSHLVRLDNSRYGVVCTLWTWSPTSGELIPNKDAVIRLKQTQRVFMYV